MKKTTLLLIFLGLAALLTACGSVGSATGGFADEGYVKVVSKNKELIKTTVAVSIDSQSSREAVVLDAKKAVRSEPHFVLKPGTHTILVSDRMGKVLYDSKIFLSAGKTKVIELR